MKPRTFIAFVAPSLAMMLVFIALPLASVFWQSFHSTQGVYEQVKVETCTPGFLKQTCVEETKTKPVLGADGRPLTTTAFVGLDTYRALLKPEAVAKAFAPGGGGFSQVLDIDFYRALRFTVTFTLVTLPLVIGLGLLVAIALDNAVKSIKGPLIFVSLLPFIITPVIGSMAVRWLFAGDGILGGALKSIYGPGFTMFAQGWTIELMMMLYRVWHVAPFAFVIFYAGLQTVDQDTLESAIVDGASRLERLRLVTVPHLMPLIIFVSLIHLMDAYRVFDEVIGFSSEAHRVSLQWLTFHFLNPDAAGNRAISSASASSMLTMAGIVVILIPLLVRTWRDHRGTR